MIDFNWFALYVGIGALLLILEPETAHAEIVEHTKYGNYCDVIIDRDVFTDEETTFLMCYGSDIGGDPPMRGYSITIFCRGDEEKLFEVPGRALSSGTSGSILVEAKCLDESQSWRFDEMEDAEWFSEVVQKYLERSLSKVWLQEHS